jgi:hypothetical protein
MDESNGLVPKKTWYQKLCDKLLKWMFLITAIFQLYASVFIFRFVAFIITKILGENLLDKLRMKFHDSRSDEDMHKKRKKDIQFLESVNLSEYDVLLGIQSAIFLVNKTNKEDIRYFSGYDHHDLECSKQTRKMFKELKKYFSRSKPLTQQDYITFLNKLRNVSAAKTSVQILMMFNQNGMKIDDRICEDFENFQAKSVNYVRCLYERVLMLKMLQHQRKQRCKISLKPQPKDEIQL